MRMRKVQLSFFLISLLVIGALIGGIGGKLFDVVFFPKGGNEKSAPTAIQLSPMEPPPIGSTFKYEINYTQEGMDLGGVIVRPGDILEFKINNRDTEPHDFTIDLLDITSETILPQQSRIIVVSIPAVDPAPVYQWYSKLDEGDFKYSGAIIVIVKEKKPR
jgi:hypothetical protein